MTSTSRLKEFNPEFQDVDTFLLQFKYYLIANGVKDNEKISHFIIIVGSKVVSTLVELFSPDAFDSKPYANVIAKFRTHYKPER